MSASRRLWPDARVRVALGVALGVVAYVFLLWTLRHSSYSASPLLGAYMDMAGSLIAFTFAANAMVRFRGTRDRISLILGFGFVLAGLIEAATSLASYRGMLIPRLTGDQISLGWFAGRTLLGVLLLAALVVEKRIPVAREPGKEIAGATLIVGAAAYLISVFYFLLPHAPSIQPDAWVPRPWDLFPAAIFAVATVGYGLRLRRADAWLDRTLFLSAALNFLCHVTISQSQQSLDACDMAARGLMVLSYVAVLGGTLLDNAKLFDQVSLLASSDPLTGLANHRQMLEVIEGEIQR